MASKKEENGEGPTYYDDEANLKKLCDFLRSKNGVPVREAVQMDQRVYYLKGEYTVQKKRWSTRNETQ